MNDGETCGREERLGQETGRNRLDRSNQLRSHFFAGNSAKTFEESVSLIE